MTREAPMQSEQQFRSLIEHCIDAIVLFTLDGTIIYASPSTVQVTGYTVQELVGLSSFALIHSEDQGYVNRLVTNLVRNAEDCVSFEYRLCHKNGTWRWVEGTATNLLEDPAVSAIACTFRDITKHKQLLIYEQTTRAESEARANLFAAVFEVIVDGVAICDCEGRLEYTNAAFRTLFALEADSDSAQLYANEWRGWVFQRDQEGRQLTQDLWLTFQSLWREHSSNSQTIDLMARSGTEQDLFLSVSGVPIRDDAGQITGGIVIYRDVTQRHEMEEQAQYAERKFCSLIESNVVGIMVTDEEGRMYEVNDRLVQFLGYSREELLSGAIRVQDLMVAQYRGARARAWKTLISQGASLPEEKVYRRKSGGRIPALVAASAINSERNRALVVIMDISEQKEAERRRQEFLSMVNHELRTPLTVIQGFLELAQMYVERLSVAFPQEVKNDNLRKLSAMLQQTQQQAAIEARLVAELLDMSRIEVQKFSLSLQWCNLITLVQQVIVNQQQVVSTRYVELVLPPQSVVPVMADPDRIEQVLTNYLTNAFKYSPPDRQVEVLVQVEGVMARVSVRDQGVGLTSEQQQHIWERFYQAETAGHPGASEGLGLGLYIVRTIIAQHQGQVGVESSPGEGAAFWFMLPLADDASKESQKDE